MNELQGVSDLAGGESLNQGRFKHGICGGEIRVRHQEGLPGGGFSRRRQGWCQSSTQPLRRVSGHISPVSMVPDLPHDPKADSALMETMGGSISNKTLDAPQTHALSKGSGKPLPLAFPAEGWKRRDKPLVWVTHLGFPSPGLSFPICL